MHTWNLDSLYSGLDDQKFINDKVLLTEKIDSLNALATSLDVVSVEKVTEVLTSRNELNALIRTLAAFLSLNESVDAANNAYKSELGQLMQTLASSRSAQAIIDQYLANISNLDELLNDEYINDHAFYLQEIIDRKKYQLPADQEALIAKININGVNNWEDLYDYITASYTMDYNGEPITLTKVRNLAYSADPKVRKEAYEDEIAGYKGIEDALAYSLNSIKGHVNTMVELRGYEDALEMTLISSRMQRSTLDALFGAIDASLPKFRAYLQHKAKLLGHENGLPFYDLFAPLVKSEEEYTIEKAESMVYDSFKTFSDDLANLVQRAFDNNWIDYLPRDNKRGGAFCSNLPMIKESRVLHNFGNDLGSVVTLAHELGHAYHGHKIENHHMLNTGYVMPIAETASNFCELILSEAALKTASRTSKIELLENMISDATQVIVDIYSRFLFEQSVLDARHNQFLSADDLKALMLDAQRKTYGEGLDQDVMHPYMWACKGHYYSSGLNFYNFPYAYGALFSKGLYAKYLEEGESFVSKYENMLAHTTILSTEDIGTLAGVDVSTQAFWESSLGMLTDMIDEFMELTKEGL
ncbi:MAG: M3 family oligoendopeptidase [Erysipelothrix sp.]|nr:M3 family oligoendopeptidase [Erysipelothrix sp.]